MKKPFKKLTLLAHKNERDRIICALQELGVLHLKKSEPKENEELEDAVHYCDTLSDILKLIRSIESVKSIPQYKEADVELVVNEILSLEEEITHLYQQVEADEKEHDKMLPWGDYSYDRFVPLLESGYNLFLCNATQKVFDKLDLSGVYHSIVNLLEQQVYFVAFTREEDLELSIEYIPFTQNSIGVLQQQIHQNKLRISELYQQINTYASYESVLNQAYVDAQDQVELLEAKNSTEILAMRAVIRIIGWYPKEKDKVVVDFLENLQVAYVINEPKPGENVPVLLNNTAYTKQYEPITQIFELPNYHEADLTPFIAVFYPILFAYCLGDAGYGLALFVMMSAGFFTFLKNKKNVAILGSILGVVTMIMGLVKSGTLFGIMLVENHNSALISYLSKFVIIHDDSEFIFNAFNVALMIGVVQIFTGILISIFNKIRYEQSLTAVSGIGKLCIVTSLLWMFLADMQKLEFFIAFGEMRVVLLITGIVLVTFFHEIGVPLWKRAVNAIMPLFFTFTGILGDILSYVRLFALGLASSVLGLVVNQIGMQIMEGGLVSMVIGVLFLVFGHSLNFGIAALGSFVHPLRLTFVEFYGNANFKGKGVAYKPFSKSTYNI